MSHVDALIALCDPRAGKIRIASPQGTFTVDQMFQAMDEAAREPDEVDFDALCREFPATPDL